MIDGIIKTSLKKIFNPKGDIYQLIRNDSKGFKGFGEVYISTIKIGEIKGWKKHNKMTMNLVVPLGEIKVVIYDDRSESCTKGFYYEEILSIDNYCRLTIPPGLWMSFKGLSKAENILINFSDICHDPNESENIPLDVITYNWN